MGCTPEQGTSCQSDEKPAHSVTLNDYYIGYAEINRLQWNAVMTGNSARTQNDMLPQNGVSWNQCQKFIEKLNEQTGLKFRLPTEAEWEYAARGGNHSRGYKYPGTNTSTVSLYNSLNEVYKTSSNELDILGMNGNVWEWCQDWYGPYNSNSQVNPQGPASGNHKVMRGGSFRCKADDCRVSNRDDDCPNCCVDDRGFRLALDMF